MICMLPAAAQFMKEGRLQCSLIPLHIIRIARIGVQETHQDSVQSMVVELDLQGFQGLGASIMVVAIPEVTLG